MSELHLLDACAIADAVRQRHVSPLEVLDYFLGRIERVNPPLNAFVHVDAERARAEARAQGEAVAQGDDPGLFAGVPLGVKDLEAAAGMPLTFGSLPFAHNVADRDSVQVARLKAAGCIVVGKTNTPEHGYTGWTTNRLFGPTRNPWDPSRTPGGSSGGSGAAVAAGMVPLATGSDAGGSIRIPASFCGVYGLKPSFGRIPRADPAPPGWRDISHLGPLCWSVRDAARWLDVAAGPHPDDLDCLDAPTGRYEGSLRLPERPLRIGWSPDLGYATVQSEVVAVAREAAQTFAALGHLVEEVPPLFDDPMPILLTIMRVDDYAIFERRFEELKDQFDPGFRQLMEQGRGIPATEYARAQARRHKLAWTVNRFFEQYDLLLTPTMPVEPFGVEGPAPSETAGRRVELKSYTPFTYPFNLTRNPAASCPAGLSGAGLPVGLQIVGPRLRDDLVLAASAAYEAARPWARRRPPVAELAKASKDQARGQGVRH